MKVRKVHAGSHSYIVAAAAPRNDQLGIEKWRRQGLKTTGLTSQKSQDLRKIRKLTNFA